MQHIRKDIITRLQKDILFLQGFKQIARGNAVQIKLGAMDRAFPYGCFPFAAIHEFINDGPECAAATSGFIAYLLSALMLNCRTCLWISSSRSIFPPALKSFGIEPDKIIFIDLKSEKEILWVMEEALKCEGLAAVVGEVREISFTASRRLQLAIEKSQVTGFIIRNHPRNLNVNACTSRWKISPLSSEPEDNLPGVSFPCWNIELLKIKNGKPGVWQLQWAYDQLRPVPALITVVTLEQKRKTG
jgi:protein ImuA